MTDREKVIKELSWIIFHFPFQKNPKDEDDRMCNAINVYCNDAIALLKEQEPRVMTLEEVSNLPDRSPIFCEEKDPKFESEWELYMTEYDDRKYDECYGREYRYWTSRPSPEQMAKTPWEGGE